MRMRTGGMWGRDLSIHIHKDAATLIQSVKKFAITAVLMAAFVHTKCCLHSRLSVRQI